MSEAITGGCLCGAVRYRVELPERPTIYACYCTDCQTHSGSAMALQMPVFANLLHIEGETRTGRHTLPSGATGTIYVCAECSVRIYAKNSSRPGFVVVRAGTLDDSAGIVPNAHLWVKSKQSWLTLPADAIILETQPETQEDWMPILFPQESK